MAKRSQREPPSRVKPRRSRGGRSQVLPGLEGARNQRLDNIAEALVEERDRLNSAKVEEQALITAALKEMQDADLQVYKHNGVELARVPGAEKVRVRLVKEQGDADEGDLEVSEA